MRIEYKGKCRAAKTFTQTSVYRLKKWECGATRNLQRIDRVSDDGQPKTGIVDRNCMFGEIVVGSFAKGSPDRLSGTELVAFCSDGAGQSVLRAVRRQIAPADMLFTIDGEHGPDSQIQKLVLADMVSIEFQVIAPDTKLALERAFVETVNRGQCLEAGASLRAMS